MDYSPYKLKNFYDKKFEKATVPNQTVDAINEEYACKDYSVKIGKRNRIGNLLIVAIILVSFGVLIGVTEFFSGSAILNGLRESFNISSAKKYYFVAQKADDQTAAKSSSLMVKASGGAGYVFVDKTTYNVVICAYLSKKDATAVAKKNKETFVLEIGVAPPPLAKTSKYDSNQLEKAYAEIEKTIQLLYDFSVKLDTKDITPTEVLSRLASERNRLLSLKDEISKNIDEKENLAVATSLIDPTFGGIDAILSDGAATQLAASIRYVVCSAIVSIIVR